MASTPRTLLGTSVPAKVSRAASAVIISLVAAAIAHAQCQRQWIVPAAPTFSGSVTGFGSVAGCAIEWDPDGPGPERSLLVVGGDFTMVGQTALHGLRLAAWDGVSWRDFGGGTAQDAMDGIVTSLATYHGDLIAGGFFWTAGGVPASHIARYSAATGWRALGSGVDAGTYNTRVSALAEFNGDLIVGGEFQTAGGLQASNITRWTDDVSGGGGHWGLTALGGVDSGDPTRSNILGVRALAVFQGGLFVGGGFQHAGVESDGIARWDGVPGSPWAQMNTTAGSAARVSSLVVWRGELYAAGQFSEISGVPASNIIRWDGVAWRPVAGGISPGDPNAWVFGLTTFNDELIAVGQFSIAGEVSATGVARWNGVRWAPLGDGAGPAPDSAVNCATPFRGQLVVGGYYIDFAHSGSILPLWARWGCACPADTDGSGDVTTQDIFDFLNAWFALDPRADFDSVNGITTQDIFDFLSAWFAGC